METREQTDPAGGDLLIQVSTKRPRRFKAGSELSATVNLDVDMSETETAEDYRCSVSIRVREGHGV